jgi:hypothetical protein
VPRTARERAAALQAASRRAQRRRRVARWSATAVAIGGLAGGLTAAGLAHSAGNDGTTAAPIVPAGPEGVPLEVGTPLASGSTAATGQTVDGIQCSASEQVAYHIHTHLAVYVNGTLRPIPAGVGIVSPVAQQTPDGPFDSATRCYYWLHVHAQDGIIHVESPSGRTYTLGQFFAIWRQPLSTHTVGQATGELTVFVNGRRYSGDPAGITLRSQEEIQIDVGTPVVAPKKIDWDKSQL